MPAVARLGEHGVAADVAVVLVGDPRLVAQVRARPTSRSRVARSSSPPAGRGSASARVGLQGVLPVGPGERALVGRPVVRHAARRYVDHALAVPVDLQPAGVGHLADDGGVDVPLRADREERARRRRARRPPSSAPATRSSGSPRERAWSRAAAPGRGRRACRRRRRWPARRWRTTGPAPPRSWMPATSPAAKSSRVHSMSSFSMNGSPTCTLGRLAGPSLVEGLADASTETPPMPSPPVRAPYRITWLPAPDWPWRGGGPRAAARRRTAR